MCIAVQIIDRKARPGCIQDSEHKIKVYPKQHNIHVYVIIVGE